MTHDPAGAIIMGSSAGGLAAAYIAFERPELFANVLSQSGAFWRGNEGTNDPPYEWLTQQLGATPKKGIRFFIRECTPSLRLRRVAGDLHPRMGVNIPADESMAPANEPDDDFFALSIDMLCCLGFDGHFSRLNPAWERTLGFTRAELMSRPSIEFVHPDDRARTIQQNADVKAGGQALAFENRYRCKDGSYKWLLWNAASHSSRRLIYSVARDITDRKRAEEEREGLVLALKTALAEVRSLREVLPICSYCKKIRDEKNDWQTVEAYISRHTNTRFTHGVCPDCYDREIASLI